MSKSLHSALSDAIKDIQLLDHPFYRRWEAGELSHEELTRYAEQYRFFEAMLPEFLETLSNQLPEGVARNYVLENLADETGSPSHLDLFDRFAAYYGATRPTISPAMHTLVAAYLELLQGTPDASLAGLWAYETQGARIADSKAEGLAQHYQAEEEALAFWAAHGSVEEDHARWTLEALESLEPDPEIATEAARLIGSAWWEFLSERELVASSSGPLAN
jgi:pyrroloquinoline-quinone synthase